MSLDGKIERPTAFESSATWTNQGKFVCISELESEVRVSGASAWGDKFAEVRADLVAEATPPVAAMIVSYLTEGQILQ